MNSHDVVTSDTHRCDVLTNEAQACADDVSRCILRDSQTVPRAAAIVQTNQLCCVLIDALVTRHQGYRTAALLRVLSSSDTGVRLERIERHFQALIAIGHRGAGAFFFIALQISSR